ncbi:MAG: hypothetical protein ACMXYE_00630 [Candidatus Woesearchaeota archaeon]
MNFEGFIQQLNNWGVISVLLPFILVFTIVFAVLQKAKIFGEGKKNYNVMVALVMGFSVVIPHVLGTYPPHSDPVLIINNALPGVSVVLVAIVALLLLIGIMGGEVRWLGSSISGWIAIVSLAIIVFIFGRAAGWFQYGWPNWLRWLDNPDTQAFIVIILVFGIIVWYITKDESQTKNNALGDITEGIGKLFGGK